MPDRIYNSQLRQWVIQKTLGPNHFFWSALKVPPSDFNQNMPQAPIASKCLKQGIEVDKLDYFKNAS